MGHALAYRITSKFGEDMRHGYIAPLASLLDIPHYFVDHELIIIFESQGMLDRETAADVDRIQLRADLFQLAIQIDHLIQLAPIIDVVLDALVEKDMEHFQLEPVFIPFDLVHIEFEHIAGPETQPGGIERKG